MEAAENSGYFAHYWDLSFLLGSTFVLSLLICLAWKILHGSFLGDSKHWRRHQKAQPERREQPQTTADKRAGSKDEAPAQAQGPGQDSVRRLLRDNLTCALGEQVAVQAERLATPSGLGPRLRALPKLLVSFLSCIKQARLPGISTRTARDRWPPLPGRHSPPPPAAPSAPSNGLQPPRRHQADGLPEEPGGRERFGLAAWAPLCAPKPGICPADVATRQAGSLRQAFWATFEVSFSSRTDDSSSSGLSSCSHQIFLEKQEAHTQSWWGESEDSAPVMPAEQAALARKRLLLPSPDQKRAPGRHPGRRVSHAPSQSPQVAFSATHTPFVAGATWATLEWHVAAKNVQHALGLPLVLLRSCQAFMPLAPCSVAGRPARDVVAVTRPHALLFLSDEHRMTLELHLGKMVCLKRWGLPPRVQEALGHLWSAPRLPASPSPARWEEDQRTREAGGQAQDVTLRSAQAPQPQPPTPARASRVMAGRRQPPSMPSVLDLCSLQRNRDWGALDSVHATVPSWVHSPAAASASMELLESHALKKRLQHQWGLPSLVQRSWRKFSPASLPSPASHMALPEEAQPVTGHLPLLPLATLALLDSHVKSTVIGRQWGLPRQVLQSLQLFMPVSPLPAERENSPPQSPEGRAPKMERALPEKGTGPSERPPDSSWEATQVLRRHSVRKALEIQLDLFAPLLQDSHKTTLQAEKHSLPRALPPGLRPVQPRSQDLLFVEPPSLDRIKLNIIHKSLAYKWGLPTLYRISVARLFGGMVPPPPPPLPRPLLPSSATAARVPALALALAQGVREELEWHVRRKQLQHIWGLPGLVQRSLRHLLPAAPLHQHQRPGLENVAILWDKPFFLSKETQQELDLNVRKRVLLQRWGLPRVLLESQRLLCPEMGLRQTAPRSPQAPSDASCARDSSCGTVARTSAVGEGRKAPCKALVRPMLGPQELAKMTQHLAKKSVEMQLGVLPPIARRSWRLAWLALKQPLPRLIGPGQGSPRPRSGFLPFERPDDVDQIEMCVCRKHLSSLWGLGLRYVEARSVVMPMPSIPPLTAPRPRAGTTFSEVHTPFLPQPARDTLELSVRKKRLQQQWGLPALAQRSAQAFAHGGCSWLPASLQAKNHVSVLPQELLFLPQGARSHLEFHMQKLKLHRHWGLPRRVLESLRLLRPELGNQVLRQEAARPPLAGGHLSQGNPPESWAVGTVSMGPGIRRAERVVVAAAPQPLPSMLGGPKDLGKIKLHLVKKREEGQLQTFPAWAKLSWQSEPHPRGPPLPKPILPGHRPLQPRRCLLPFLRVEDLDLIELAVWRRHLETLWGLGTRYVAALGGVMPTLPLQPLRPRKAAFICSDMETPFLPGPERGTLELQVRKKRLQHLWGRPALLQRSLLGFMHRAPSRHARPQTQAPIHTQRQELTCLSPDTRWSLERRVQKMKMKRLWGLPGRVLDSMKIFLPSGPLGKVGKDRGSPRSPLSPQKALTPAEDLDFGQEMGGQERPGVSTSGRPEEAEGGGLQPGSKPQQPGRKEATEELPSGTRISSDPSSRRETPHRSPEEGAAPRPPSSAQRMAEKNRMPQAGQKAAVLPTEGERLGLPHPPQAEGREGHACPPPFQGEGLSSSPPKAIDKKLSIIGSVLEKKLSLQHGLHIWLHRQEQQQEQSGPGGLRGAGPAAEVLRPKEVQASQGAAAAECEKKGAVTESWEDVRCGCSRAADTSLEAAQKTQPLQAGRVKSPAGPGDPSASWSPSRVSGTGASDSLTLGGASSSRKRPEAGGTRPVTKGRGQSNVVIEAFMVKPSRRDQGPSSKKRRSSSRRSRSKKQRSSSRRSRSKKRRSRSKEQRSRITSKRSSGGKEQSPSSRKPRSTIREWLCTMKKTPKRKAQKEQGSNQPRTGDLHRGPGSRSKRSSTEIQQRRKERPRAHPEGIRGSWENLMKGPVMTAMLPEPQTIFLSPEGWASPH